MAGGRGSIGGDGRLSIVVGRRRRPSSSPAPSSLPLSLVSVPVSSSSSSSHHHHHHHHYKYITTTITSPPPSLSKDCHLEVFRTSPRWWQEARSPWNKLSFLAFLLRISASLHTFHHQHSASLIRSVTVTTTKAEEGDSLGNAHLSVLPPPSTSRCHNISFLFSFCAYDV